MICPSCNKFAAYDTSSEPELDLDLSEYVLDGRKLTITGTARIVLTSACCGDELKEAQFDPEIEIEIPEERECKCKEFSIRDESAEITEDYEAFSTKTLKSGKVVRRSIPYRYQKRFFGVEIEVTVACECGKTAVSATWDDKIQASSMDELV